jgi:hypothetical protein
MRKLLRKIHQRWLANRYRREVAVRTQKLHGGFGPVRQDDLVVVGLMRDVEKHVTSFVGHHLQLGAKHVVLMDNGSEDASIDTACELQDVTVLECDVPYATHKHAMKQYLCERFGQGCWCLIADLDERFEYPHSEELHLRDFLGYLNRHGFSAVVAQMLDLFSAGPPHEWPDTSAELERDCRFYDVSGIEQRAHRRDRKNFIGGGNLRKWSGGIRRTAFKMQNGPNLTKHPLLFPDRGAIPSFKSAHRCRHAHIADVTCLLKHYKFDLDFFNRCQLAVQRKNYHRESVEYRAYLSALQQTPHLVLKQETAQEYVSASLLAEQGLLWVSPAYREYCRQVACNNTKKRNPALVLTSPNGLLKDVVSS